MAQPQDNVLHGKWWTIFNDPQLNALEEQVNISNQNIQSAMASYMAARALVKEARSQYYPTVTVGPSKSPGHVKAPRRPWHDTSGTSTVLQFAVRRDVGSRSLGPRAQSGSR